MPWNLDEYACIGGSTLTHSMFRVDLRLRSLSSGDDGAKSSAVGFRGRPFATGSFAWNDRRGGFGRRLSGPEEWDAALRFGQHKTDPTNAALSIKSERKHQLGRHDASDLSQSASSQRRIL